MPTVANSVRRRLASNPSRMPKASKSKSSLSYKGAAQGKVRPFVGRYQDPSNHRPIDPAFVRTLDVLSKSEDTRFKPWSFPFSHSLTFTLRIVPKKVLEKSYHSLSSPRFHKLNEMSIRFVVPKKVHNSATVRTRMCSRIKDAIGLIVTRDAAADSVGEELHASSEDTGVDNWLLSDWTYLFYPTLETYKTPLPQLIDELRIALKAVQLKGISWQRMVRSNFWKPMKSLLSLRLAQSLSSDYNKTTTRSTRLHPTSTLENNIRGDGSIERTKGPIDYPEIVDEHILQKRIQHELEWNNIMKVFEEGPARTRKTTSEIKPSNDISTQSGEADVTKDSLPLDSLLGSLMSPKRYFPDPTDPSKLTTKSPQAALNASPAAKLFRTNPVINPPILTKRR